MPVSLFTLTYEPGLDEDCFQLSQYPDRDSVIALLLAVRSTGPRDKRRIYKSRVPDLASRLSHVTRSGTADCGFYLARMDGAAPRKRKARPLHLRAPTTQHVLICT